MTTEIELPKDAEHFSDKEGNVKTTVFHFQTDPGTPPKFKHIFVRIVYIFTFVAILSVGIYAVAIGALFFETSYCRSENIALTLINLGSFVLIFVISVALFRCKMMCNNQPPRPSPTESSSSNNILLLVFAVYYLGWWITLSTYLNRLYPKVNFEDVSSINYCHPVLFKSAFWLEFAQGVIIGVLIFKTCIYKYFCT